jgi:hypothetical protein
MGFFFKFVIPVFAAVMLGMGHVMSGGGTIAGMDKAKACEGFVVFNGEQIPKCGGHSK